MKKGKNRVDYGTWHGVMQTMSGIYQCCKIYIYLVCKKSYTVGGAYQFQAWLGITYTDAKPLLEQTTKNTRNHTIACTP